MNLRIRFTVLLLACTVAPAMAGGPSTALQGAVVRVVDCAHRSLPPQQEVGAWAGQANAGQAYATRQRLMAEIGRACKRAHVEQVQLVLQVRDAWAAPDVDRYAAADGRAR